MKKIYNRFFSVKNVMKSAFLTLLVAPTLTFGQLYYTVGTGTATNSTTSYPSPMGNWYDGLREQHLYTASELNAAGFAAGSITEIAWDVAAMPSTVGTLTNYSVYIGTTSNTSLTSWITFTGSPDYQANTTPSVGWNTLPLSTPFVWNGTDNLIIQVCFENSCGTYTRNPEIRYTTATYTSSLYYRADCTSGMCTNTTGFVSTSSNRPNVRFTVIPPVVDDAGVAEIVSPTVGNCTLGSLPTKVILNNMGSDTLRSCTVNWMVGTSTQTPFSFTGIVNPQGGTSDTISLGNFTYSDGDMLTVWTTNPNGVQDSFPNNDTLIFGVYEALGGVYTIGGTSPDFATINDAATALSERGVCSPVTMNIVQGTYNEKVVVGNVPGASSTNTVVFTSDPTNTSIVEIAASPNLDSNYVIEFNGATHVMFKDVTIDGSTGGSYGTVVSYKDAMYSGIDGCVVNGIVTTSTSASMHTIVGSGGMNSMLMNSEINGGSYSINWSGGENVYIIGNDLVDPYFYGVYLSGIELVKFNHNDLHTSNGYLYNYGLYANTIDGASEFVGNYLDWPGYMAAYFYQINGSSSESPLIANNFIRTGNGTYYGYGCYLYNSGYVRFVHNTVAKDPTSGGGYYGIYVTGGANKLINNMFYDPNGSSTYYNFYYSGAFSVETSDYNNVYSNQYFGYLNGVQQTLSAWQTNTGFDMNSTVIDPGFTSFDTLRHCNDSLDGTGTPLSYVGDDYDGDGRNGNTPDVGADEWVGSAPGSYSAGEDAFVCDGKPSVIGLAVTGGTFLWSTGDTSSTITVSAPGTYTVAMTSDCGAVHGDTVEVVDLTPVANFTVTPAAQTFLTGEFTNTSQKGDSYMWIVGTTPPDTFYTEDLTHIFPDNGPYDVCLYVMNDCDTAQICKTWQGVVGIQESELAEMIKLMPNPATDVLNIQFADVDGDVTVEMTNIQGQVVYTTRYMDINGNSMRTIDVSNLRNGMYIVKFITNGDIATKQIIVQ